MQKISKVSVSKVFSLGHTSITVSNKGGLTIDVGEDAAETFYLPYVGRAQDFVDVVIAVSRELQQRKQQG